MLKESESPPKARLFLIAPVHNRQETTEKFVKQLKEQSFENFCLILVDDGSKDKTSEIVSKLLPSRSIILKGNGNLWWAGSLNKAFHYLHKNNISDSCAIGILNDDVVFESTEYLSAALKEVEAFPNAFTCSQRIPVEEAPYCQNGVKVRWSPLSFEPAKLQSEADCTSTRGLFFQKKLLIKSGLMRPRWLPHYLSDYEFTFRAKKKGISLRVSHSIKLRSIANTWNEYYTDYNKDSIWRIIASIRDKRNNLSPAIFTAFTFLCAPKKEWIPTITLIWKPILLTLFKRALKLDLTLLFRTKKK